MSRVGGLGLDDLPLRPRAPTRFRLRARRRDPLHPEEIERRLSEQAALDVADRGPTPWGWLVIVFAPSGRITRATKENATYADAQELLRKELTWTGPCDAWIVAKQTPQQKGILP